MFDKPNTIRVGIKFNKHDMCSIYVSYVARADVVRPLAKDVRAALTVSAMRTLSSTIARAYVHSSRRLGEAQVDGKRGRGCPPDPKPSET